MDKILVPIDYTSVSENAVTYAMEFAKARKASVILYHALHIPVPSSEIPLAYITEKDLRTEATRDLENYASKVSALYPDVKIEWNLTVDFVKNGIAEASKTNNVSLIIMGLTPAGFLERITGSNSTNLLDDLEVPLIIVPVTAKFKVPVRIMVAFDLRTDSPSELFSPVKELATQFQSEVMFAHIGNESSNSKSEKFIKELQIEFKDVPHTFSFHENEDVYSGIENLLIELKADLLVMCHHERNFFSGLFSESHTRKMVWVSELPVMVVTDHSN